MSVIQPLATGEKWTVRRATPRSEWRRDLGRAVADTSYVALRLSGWLIMTTLASMGVLVLFFLMLGNFTPLGFFSHLGNLGTRFVAADGLRRATFMSQVHVVEALVFALVAIARGRLLLTILVPAKGASHG